MHQRSWGGGRATTVHLLRPGEQARRRGAGSADEGKRRDRRHDLQDARDRPDTVIDVSESMMSTDVAPNRLAAAKEAGKQFTDELTPSINLGLVAFAGNASLLVAPTTNRTAMKAAIDQLSSRTHRDWGGHLHRAAGHCYGGCGAGWGRRTACAGANRAGIRRQGDGTVRPGSAQGCLHRRPRRQRTRRTNLDNLFRHPRRLCGD